MMGAGMSANHPGERKDGRDLRADVEELLFAMVIDELFGFDTLSISDDGPEIVGLRMEQDELGVEFEPIIYDEKRADPPNNASDKYGRKRRT